MATGTMHRVTQVVTGVAGSPFYLTCHFDAEGGTASDAALDWRAFLAADSEEIPAPMVLSPISEVVQVDSVTGDLVGYTVTAVPSLVGSADTSRLPAATQGLVRWRTNDVVAGRRVRGRTAIPWPGTQDNNINTGTPTTGWRDYWNTKAAAFIAKTTSTPVIYARKSGEFSAISSGSVWEQWSTLRSRRD